MDLEKIKISSEEEQKIREKSPTKLPLNSTLQGWSGENVRQQFAKALLDKDSSVLSELKSKLEIIKDAFEKVFGNSENDIQGQINFLLEQVSNRLLVFESVEDANDANLPDNAIAFIKIKEE